MDASSKLKVASNGDVSFRDFSLGSAAPTRSLTHQDDLVYARLARKPVHIVTAFNSVPSLSSICVKLFSHNWQQNLNRLQPDHILSAQQLLDSIEEVSEGNIPFQVFAKFAATFSHLPLKRRTFKRVVLEDLKEISWIKELNDEGRDDWRRERERMTTNMNYAKRRNRPYIPVEVESPTFFLSTLDLSHSTFLDNHIHKLKPLSTFLAVLRLDFTNITDSGVSNILRGVEKEEYEKLEILTLKGLKRVTDVSALKVVLLPSLRMLDLRSTSCTTAFRTILDKKLKGSSTSTTLWRPARHRSNLNNNISLELQLFGPSYSPSRLLTFLRILAAQEHSHPSNELLEKPVTLQITALTRFVAPSTFISATGSEKSAEELYVEQIALSRSNAAYNSVYGGITCTTNISRGILEEDAHEERKKGSAFAEHSVAAGVLVNKNPESRNTLFSVGQRKFSNTSGSSSSRDVEEVLSDWGSDQEDLTETEIASNRRRQEQQESPFYRLANPLPPILPRSKRVAVAAEASDLMLLRHLPLRHPCERVPPSLITTVAETDSKPLPVLDEGSQLKRKRIVAQDLPFRPTSITSTSASNSTTSFPSSSSSSSAQPSNPFAKKLKPLQSPPTSTSTLSSKVIVASLAGSSSKLPGRSSMTAFARK